MKTEALSWFQLLFRQPSTFFKIFSVIIRIPVHICWNRHVNPFHLTRSQREMRSEILGNMKYVSALLDSLQRTEDFKHEKCCEILLMDRKHSSLLRFLEDDRAVQGQIQSSLASYSLCDSRQDGEVWTRTTRVFIKLVIFWFEAHVLFGVFIFSHILFASFSMFSVPSSCFKSLFFLSPVSSWTSFPIILPSAIIHRHSSVRPPTHQSIHSLSLIDKQISPSSSLSTGPAHFHLRAHAGVLSHFDFLSLSLTHTFQSPLCEQLLFILIYIHLHPFSSLAESEFITVTHLGKVLLLTEGDADGGRRWRGEGGQVVLWLL